MWKVGCCANTVEAQTRARRRWRAQHGQTTDIHATLRGTQVRQTCWFGGLLRARRHGLKDRLADGVLMGLWPRWRARVTRAESPCHSRLSGSGVSRDDWVVPRRSTRANRVLKNSILDVLWLALDPMLILS